MNICLCLIFILFGRNSDQFKSELDQLLSSYFKDYVRFEYQIVSQPKGEIVIDNDREIKISGNIGYIPVWFKNNAGERTQSVVSIKLKLYRKALIALKKIKSGDVLSPEDFGTDVKDVSQTRGEIFDDTTKISRYQAKLTIEKNEILLDEMLAKAPLIRRGDEIIACVIKGNVRIDVDATARQDGSENDIISIVTSDKKTFRARVLDRFTAIIVE